MAEPVKITHRFKMDDRPTYPQVSFIETTFDPNSFFGILRQIYSNEVLLNQLKQLKAQGSYDAFKLQWHPSYDIRRLHGGKARVDGLPPSLFWESDIGKWIESACYYLSSNEKNGTEGQHDEIYRSAVDELIEMIKHAQQPDGYLNIYFTVVDKEGRFRNLRDMHEMYNAGHLLEGALAHHFYTGKSDFLDAMIRNVSCFERVFGSEEGKKPGYPGHPELELALLRLAEVSKDPSHRSFAKHLLSARGTVVRGDSARYFEIEAEARNDDVYGSWMRSFKDFEYHQAHKPLHEQEVILGHSVRAFYLLTACADYGEEFAEDAKRLWRDATFRKMYVTGGFGSEARSEGFSDVPYYLPSSKKEGGCYCETCASIAAMMTAERLLSHSLDGDVREVMELALYNAVIGGGSLDGRSFNYTNVLATYGDESAKRAGWYEVCCCPPNLSRTIAMLGGYIWAAKECPSQTLIIIYIFATAERSINVNGNEIKIKMESDVPHSGSVKWSITSKGAPVNVTIQIPMPSWAENVQFSHAVVHKGKGYVEATFSQSLSMTFEIPVRLLSDHPAVGQDVLVVSRGPLIYVAEDFDNRSIEKDFAHFEGLGISESATFEEGKVSVAEGIDIISLTTHDIFYRRGQNESRLWNRVESGKPIRHWVKLHQPMIFIPWFARACRGGNGHLRVPLKRVGLDAITV